MNYDLSDIKEAYVKFKVGTVVLYEYDSMLYLCEIVENRDYKKTYSSNSKVIANDLLIFDSDNTDMSALSGGWDIISNYLKTDRLIRFIDISGLTFDEWREANAEYFI